MKLKGFTLIELLAVILILGVVALITVPTVTGVIKESETKSFKVSAENIMKAAELQCQLEQLKGDELTEFYEINDGIIGPTLDVKGKMPSYGSIVVDDSCNVQFFLMDDKQYMAYKIFNNDVIVIDNGKEFTCSAEAKKDSISDPIKTIYLNPETGNLCTEEQYETNLYSFDADGNPTNLKSGCMKWHVYSKNSDGTYNALLDHNTTEWYSWNSTGVNLNGPSQDFMAKLKADTSTWLGLTDRSDSYSFNNGKANYTINYTGLKARLISAEEIINLLPNGKTGILKEQGEFVHVDSCFLEFYLYIQKIFYKYEVGKNY